MSAAYVITTADITQLTLAAGIVYGGLGLIVGIAIGKALARQKLDALMAEARRWRFWRRHHFYLASYQCARAAGLDLSRVYVNSPERLDQVTDTAIAAQAITPTQESIQ
jgi:CBS domain containing-hemolysin-like protein